MSSSPLPDILDKPNGIHRRRMLRAAAWSVPVIAVAATTPLAAASGTVTVRLDSADTPTTGGAAVISGVGAAPTQVPLSFALTDGNGVKVTSGTLSATLDSADGTAAWTDSGGSPFVAATPDADGYVVLMVDVSALNQPFFVTVAVNGTSIAVFTITVLA